MKDQQRASTAVLLSTAVHCRIMELHYYYDVSETIIYRCIKCGHLAFSSRAVFSYETVMSHLYAENRCQNKSFGPSFFVL